jgi:hypothetical protein
MHTSIIARAIGRAQSPAPRQKSSRERPAVKSAAVWSASVYLEAGLNLDCARLVRTVAQNDTGYRRLSATENARSANNIDLAVPRDFQCTLERGVETRPIAPRQVYIL